MKRLLTLLAIVIICADKLYAKTEINKPKLSWQIKDFSIDLMHQAGIQHWPFHQLRLGTTWSYPILKTRQAAHQ